MSAVLDEIDDVFCFMRESSNERRFMSVTSVARRCGLVRWFIQPEKLAELARFGRDVHMACEDLARGDTPAYWRETPAAPYVNAFQYFCDEWQFKAELMEEKLIDESIGFVGKLDLAGEIFTGTKSRRRRAVIEIKKGARSGWHCIQTAAYEHLLTTQKGWRNVDRICVYLRGDGTFDAVRHPDVFDFSRFTALLTTARLREEWKLVSKEDEVFFDRLIRF